MVTLVADRVVAASATGKAYFDVPAAIVGGAIAIALVWWKSDRQARRKNVIVMLGFAAVLLVLAVVLDVVGGPHRR